MTAVTTARDTQKQVGDPIPACYGGPLAAATTIPKGAMAAIDAAGNLVNASASTAIKVLGRSKGDYANAGAAGAIFGEVEFGVFAWANGDSITAADIGAPAYAMDNATVSKGTGSGARPFAGVIVNVNAQGAWVLMGFFLRDSVEGQGIGTMQVTGGTWVAGTATIAAGITVTAATDAFVVATSAITGSTNVGCFQHVKASNVVGGPGVGSIIIRLLGDDGAVDADAAGTFRALLIG